jgi:hypothetical protein
MTGTPLWLEIVQAASFGAAIFTAWTGFGKIHRDRREAINQAKRDLEWRQTVEAQAAIRRMTGDHKAQDAMKMLDWNGRHYEIRPGVRERITWNDVRIGLRTQPGRFVPKEVFIRDRFDCFFDHFQLIQQQIDNHIFSASQIKYPVGYYYKRIKHAHNWRAFREFIHKYDYELAKRLIDTTNDLVKSSGEIDDLEAGARFDEEPAGGEER